MDSSILGGSDRGVSPVIGVVLMVAVTVILAAVLGSVVMSTAGDVSGDTIQATFTFEEAPNGDVEIRHAAGDTLDAEALTVVVDGNSVDAGFSGTVSPGDRGTVPTANVSSGDEIVVRYTDDSGNVVILGTYTAA